VQIYDVFVIADVVVFAAVVIVNAGIVGAIRS